MAIRRRKIFEKADREILKTERALISDFRAELKNLQKRLGEIFGKHEIGGVLTREELAKYNREQKILRNMRRELGELYRKSETHIYAGLKRTARVSFQSEIAGIQRQIDDTRQIARLKDLKPPKASELTDRIDTTPSGLTPRETIRKNQSAAQFGIQREFRRGVIEGDTLRQMGIRFKSFLNKEIKKMIVVTETEGTRMLNEGKNIAFDATVKITGPVKKIWWHAGGGAEDRPGHVAMDGQEEKNGTFTNPVTGNTTTAPGLFGLPSEDVNCYCRLRLEP